MKVYAAEITKLDALNQSRYRHVRDDRNEDANGERQHAGARRIVAIVIGVPAASD